jgi:hypothetical protein
LRHLLHGEIHRQDQLHLGERLMAQDDDPRILHGKGRLVAEKLVNGISFHCHFTVGRRHPALYRRLSTSRLRKVTTDGGRGPARTAT